MYYSAPAIHSHSLAHVSFEQQQQQNAFPPPPPPVNDPYASYMSSALSPDDEDDEDDEDEDEDDMPFSPTSSISTPEPDSPCTPTSPGSVPRLPTNLSNARTPAGGATKKNSRRTWNHCLEKLIFTPHEVYVNFYSFVSVFII